MWECRHYVVGVAYGGVEDEDGEGLEAFYGRLGVAVLPTVCDGDCGVDVMMHMLGEASTEKSRAALREEPGNGKAK